MISLYPSKLEGLPFEQYRIPAPVTLLSWIENTKSALWHWLIPNEAKTGIALDFQPVSCTVNGAVIAVSQWPMYGITPDDDVVFVFEAQGSVIGGAFNIIGKVFGAVFRVFTPSIKTPSTNTQEQGDEIDKANIEANQAKLNDYVAQLFGRNRRYPDLLVQTRRTYIGNKQYTFMHLCVGIGHHQINPLEVFIGNTSLASLGDDASLEIFQPGHDHSGNEATQNWYPAPEVGGTSSGDAGLDINPTFSVERFPTASAYNLGPVTVGDDDDATQGGYIAIPSGAGSFPNGWAAGMEVSVLAPQSVQFVKDADGYFGFVGPVDGFDYAIGDAIDIDGDIRGQQWHIIDKETDSSGDTLYWLADTKNVRPDWLKEQEYSVFITPKGGRFVITSTDAQGSWVDNDNNGVNDADEDDDDSNDNEYTPAQQIIVQYRLSDGTASDWNGFDARSSTDAVITLADDGSQGGWAGPFPVCPENEVTNKFEWDISFPNGLIEFGHTSDHTYAVTFPYDLQYRDMSVGGTWTTLSRSVTQKTADEYAITDSLTLDTAARYEVRIRRSSAPKGDQYTHDTGQWYGLRGLLDRPNTYADVTSIALKVRTGARLAAQSENKVWCYATRMLPPYNDANGNLIATRDIAPAVMYMFRKLGYTDNDVDMDELGRLQAIWTQRGDTFDMQYTDETSLLDALNQALGVGYAELIIDHGRIVPIRDEARTTFDHMYSPQNMTSELKISSQLKNVNDKDQYDGIDVEYQSAITNKKETVECRLPTDSGAKVQKLTLYGVTDRTRAWRWGMRQRAIQKYRTRSFEYQTGFDALNSGYLDYCQVSGDYDQYSMSGQILDYSTVSNHLHLQLDRDVPWDADSDYVISLRMKDGSAAGPYSVLGIADDGLPYIDDPDISINTDLRFDLTHYVYGIRKRAFFPVLVQSVSPSGSPLDDQEPQVTVQAVNYDQRVYQYDDATPPTN